MTGGNVPYHLRPNKYVERRLFIELLEHLDRWRSIRDAAYVSMGGWLLEDHKMLHDRFDTRLLVSLEADDLIHARQLYNAPLGFINCTREDTTTFIENFDGFSARHSSAIRVIWFDYASAKNRQSQLREVQTLISKMDAGDVLKLTMNANPRSLCDWNGIEDPTARQEAALDGLTRKLGPYMPTGVDARQMTDEGLAAVLLEAIRKAILDGMSASPGLVARPVTAFRYGDGPHQMVTATVVLIETTDLKEFETKTRLANWPMTITGWGPVHAIKVPDLSLRERFLIDSKLFVQSDAMIHDALPFKFHRESAESFGIFQDYVKHYRRYPSYIRVGQ